MNRYIYLMLLPVIIYFLIFQYQPMYGAQIAFRQYNPSEGIWGSPWIGLKYFEAFLTSGYFFRILKNTLILNLYNLLFDFPIHIVMALLINEVRISFFKRTVQTVTYIPHFISVVVMCGITIDFVSKHGLINSLITTITGREPIMFMVKPEWFRTIYISTSIWQSIGWGTIIFLAALSNIDPNLYEAAMIDGAGKLKQIWHVTLPCLLPTIIILLILRMGRMMNVGAEKILLLYNPLTYETGDVISTFVYRKGLLEMNFSYSTAVGLFNSMVNLTFLLTMNRISRKVSETSLW